MYLNFKPNNILIGLALSTLLPNPPFLFDFSHSQLYRSPQIFLHVSFEHRGKTPLDSAFVAFSLINYHLGNQHWVAHLPPNLACLLIALLAWLWDADQWQYVAAKTEPNTLSPSFVTIYIEHSLHFFFSTWATFCLQTCPTTFTFCLFLETFSPTLPLHLPLFYPPRATNAWSLEQWHHKSMYKILL